MREYDLSFRATPADPSAGMVKMRSLSEGVFPIRWACTPEHQHNSMDRLGVVSPDKDALSVNCAFATTWAEKAKMITKSLWPFML
jgi:hypothetical protein